MFKKILLILIVSLITVTSCSAAETIKIKNKHGYTTGYFKQNNNTIKEYNKYGTHQYTYKKKGNTLVKYDKYGKRL